MKARILATLAITTPALAGVYVSDPDRLWTNGIVYYDYNQNLNTVGVCQDSDPEVFCDINNPEPTCTQFVACIPLTNGRCVGGDSDDFDWPVCDTSNGNADCDAEGVTGGQCIVTLVSAMCIAMQLWDEEASLDFVEFNCPNGQPTCPGNTCIEGTPANHIAITSTQGASSQSSSIGMNGAQEIRIRLRTGRVGGYGMAHELAHALGLYHEQSRRDRNDFVTVNTDNAIEEVSVANWDIESNSQHYPRSQHFSPGMDFGSIMMYALCRFSDCGDGCNDNDPGCLNDPSNCQTMTRDVPWGGGADTCCIVNTGDPCIGQRNHFSQFDKLTMKFLYPKNNWRFVDKWYDFDTESGTFQRPHKSFPDGASAAPNNATLWIQPGGYPSTGVYKKPMLIKAPLGGVILRD